MVTEPLRLRAHPGTPSTAIRRIEVTPERLDEGGLTLTYRAYGDLDRLKVPEPSDAGRTDGLWEHTCFEAFLRSPFGEGYLEFNFAPSGRWASYRFDGYRAGMRPASVEPWAWQIWREADHLAMEIHIEPGRMVRPDLPPPDWRMALSAVIEDTDGGKSYWALTHPSDKPDFHHPDSFSLVLPAPERP